MFNFSKSEKMHLLELIKQGIHIPCDGKHGFMLFELVEDGLINTYNNPHDITLTYYGLKELNDWDPILQVSINDQLVCKPYAEA